LLAGVFLAVVALVLTTTENSLKYAQSGVSSTSASRKLEMIALLLPTSGVLFINQLVISVYVIASNSMVDITALQWY